MADNPHPFYPNTVFTYTNEVTLDFIKANGCSRIAEFGILHGATSLEIAKHLDGKGHLHLYDFAYNVDAVVEKASALGLRNVEGFGCSTKTLDSYNWPLMHMIERNPSPIYDYVFLDGAHTWNVDALTFLLADKLLDVGGYMDFDDFDWSLSISPTLRPDRFPATAELYTPEQIKTKQVEKILDVLVRRDDRYKEVVANKIFQKIAA